MPDIGINPCLQRFNLFLKAGRVHFILNWTSGFRGVICFKPDSPLLPCWEVVPCNCITIACLYSKLRLRFMRCVESENGGTSRFSDGILPAVCTLKTTHAETVGTVAFAFGCSHVTLYAY